MRDDAGEALAAGVEAGELGARAVFDALMGFHGSVTFISLIGGAPAARSARNSAFRPCDVSFPLQPGAHNHAKLAMKNGPRCSGTGGMPCESFCLQAPRWRW
jgi:hypothetical protein